MAMTESEIQRVVELTIDKAVPEAIDKALTRYGIDAANPIEVQKDQQHLRTWRTRMDNTSSRVWMAVVLVAVGFGTQMFGAGIVDYIKTLT